MDNFYFIVKFLHVAAVIAWLGGSLSLAIVSARLPVTSDRLAALALASHASFYGKAVIGSSSGIALLSGVVLWLKYGIGGMWIMLGLGGMVFHFIVGGAVLGRTAGALEGLLRDPSSSVELLIAKKRRLGMVSIVYLLAMALIVYVMVAKPA
jgi:hypothetical protein